VFAPVLAISKGKHRFTAPVVNLFFHLQTVDELVLRNFNYCVIDEVDSILIDEARTPLIISGLAEKPSDRYYKAAKIAEAFEQDIHYTVSANNSSLHEYFFPCRISE
jgi:preprotein translocase subunit SecA